MMSAASVPPHSGEADGAPPSRTRSLRARPDSHSSVLRERPFGVLPGDVPFHLGCLSGASRANAPRATQLFGRLADRSPRACPGRAAVLGGFPLAYSGSLDRDVRPGVRADEPLENSKASTSIFVLQATKSQRRMPWRLKPKKDVGDCEKPREAVYQASIRGCPNGATQHLS